MKRHGPLRGTARVASAVARRPDLWPVAVAVAWRLAPRGWWHRWPPLPYPDAAYWRFRMETAYGGQEVVAPESADVVTYLQWCRHRWRSTRQGLR